MSMTYYAVTDDPNELAHFGILGMKWGRRRTPEQLGHPRHSGSRKRSAAYKKAQSKLGKMMKSGIKKAEAHWKEYNSPKAKEARFMKKAMQQARNGTLKYGKLTDDQVRKVTDRLALERNARMLGSTENPRYAKRLKTAIGEGIIRGIGGGTGAYIEERFRGRGRTTAEIKGAQRKARHENSIAGRREQRREAKAAQRREFLKTAYEEGDMNALDRAFYTPGERAKYLSEVKERNRLSDIRKQNEKTFNTSYYSNMGKNAAEWAKSRAGDQSNSDWTKQQKYPLLGSGSSYSVTRTTYKAPSSNTVIYVDKEGTARLGRQGRNKKRRGNT